MTASKVGADTKKFGEDNYELKDFFKYHISLIYGYFVVNIDVRKQQKCVKRSALMAY